MQLEPIERHLGRLIAAAIPQMLSLRLLNDDFHRESFLPPTIEAQYCTVDEVRQCVSPRRQEVRANHSLLVIALCVCVFFSLAHSTDSFFSTQVDKCSGACVFHSHCAHGCLSHPTRLLEDLRAANSCVNTKRLCATNGACLPCHCRLRRQIVTQQHASGKRRQLFLRVSADIRRTCLYRPPRLLMAF